MGFFSELKEDLSQAVNELVPNEELEEGKEVSMQDAKTEALFEAAEAEFEEELEYSLEKLSEYAPVSFRRFVLVS